MASRACQRTFLLGFVPHFHAKKKKSYHAEPQRTQRKKRFLSFNFFFVFSWRSPRTKDAEDFLRLLVLGAFCPGSVRINHLARNQQFKYNTNNNAKQRQYGGNLGALSA
jgi:hypothetical protein